MAMTVRRRHGAPGIALLRYFIARTMADRLLVAWPAMLAATALLAFVVGRSMMVEQEQATLAFLGSGIRLALMLAVTSITAIAIARDFDSREMEFLASRVASRLDLLLAMVATALLLATGMVVMAIPLMFMMGSPPPLGVFLWALTLALEAGLCGIFAIFIALAIANATIAILATLGWYVLARLSGMLLGLAGVPAMGDPRLAAEPAAGPAVAAAASSRALAPDPASLGDLVDPHRFGDALAHLFPLLLPRLDLLAQSDWLVHPPQAVHALLPVAAQCLVHGALVASAAFLDFRHRSF